MPVKVTERGGIYELTSSLRLWDTQGRASPRWRWQQPLIMTSIALNRCSEAGHVRAEVLVDESPRKVWLRKFFTYVLRAILRQGCRYTRTPLQRVCSTFGRMDLECEEDILFSLFQRLEYSSGGYIT